MAAYVLSDCEVYLGGYDLTGNTNQVTMAADLDMLDDTNFASGGARSFKAGLHNVTGTINGFASVSAGASDEDAVLAANLGLPDIPLSISATDGTVGSPVTFINAVQGTYTPPAGEVGQLASFSANFSGRGARMLVGDILHPATARTSSSSGTAIQTGAVSASQYLYAVLHITAVSGSSPTLDVKVQSDNAEGFPSATDRITFTQANAIGSQYATRVAGAITDDWWRVTWTIGGSSTPTFTFFCGIAIAA